MRELKGEYTIRKWEDMVEEFGINKYGDISCGAGFVKDMKQYCGEKVTIISGSNDYYYIKEHAYAWSRDMFEECNKLKRAIRKRIVKKEKDLPWILFIAKFISDCGPAWSDNVEEGKVQKIYLIKEGKQEMVEKVVEKVNYLLKHSYSSCLDIFEQEMKKDNLTFKYVGELSNELNGGNLK